MSCDSTVDRDGYDTSDYTSHVQRAGSSLICLTRDYPCKPNHDFAHAASSVQRKKLPSERSLLQRKLEDSAIKKLPLLSVILEPRRARAFLKR